MAFDIGMWLLTPFTPESYDPSLVPIGLQLFKLLMANY